MSDIKRPEIGTPIGRKQMVMRGLVVKSEYKRGKLAGWQHDTHPLIEYPDGTREVVESLAETDWQRP